MSYSNMAKTLSHYHEKKKTSQEPQKIYSQRKGANSPEEFRFGQRKRIN